MKLLLPIIALMLSGCVASNAKTFHAGLEQSAIAEEEAIAIADKDVGETCAKGKMPDQIPRSAYVKFNQCATRIFESHVLPVAAYPELFMKYRAQSLETAQQYQDGSISFAQVQARGKINWVDYLEGREAKARGTLQHLETMDAAERATMQRAMQNTPMTSHTNCTSYGGSTRCTTW